MAHDTARVAAALLAGGVKEHAGILEAAALATMFEPHHQPDARILGISLAFHDWLEWGDQLAPDRARRPPPQRLLLSDDIMRIDTAVTARSAPTPTVGMSSRR